MTDHSAWHEWDDRQHAIADVRMERGFTSAALRLALLARLPVVRQQPF